MMYAKSPEKAIQLMKDWFFFKDSLVFSHCAFYKIEWACIIFKIMADAVAMRRSAY